MLTPLPHQVEDARYMASRTGTTGNFSGMGTGKTVTTLEALRIARNTQSSVQSLIIAPPIALQMWADSVEAQLGVTSQILKTGKTRIDESVAVVVVSYAIAAKRLDLHRKWLAVIADESHALKSVESKRTRAIIGSRGIIRGAVYFWPLTGTPIVRHADDLYPFLVNADKDGMRTRCGSLDKARFDLQFCITQTKQYHPRQRPKRVVVGSRRGDELRDWVYGTGLAVRRTLADVWDKMPPLNKSTLRCPLTMTPELRVALKALEGMPLSQVEKALQDGDPNMAATRRLIGEAKVKAAADFLIEEIEAGTGPILVGLWHRSVSSALRDRLTDKGIKVQVLDGSTSLARKSQLQDDFNAGRLDVLLGQISSMGVSLNLQAGGNRIVTVEEDWSPTIMDQFFARLHRMGQEKAVFVQRLVADNKIDAAVGRVSARKARFAGAVSQGM